MKSQSLKYKILILALFMFAVAVPVLAAPSWWPIVPCGTSVNPAPCTRCDLFKLISNVIDFVLIGLMPPVATGLFVWAGFLILMGGANPGWISQGKTIFWNTFMGVMVLLASWLITNTIIQSISDPQKVPGPWWEFQCTTTVGGGGPGPVEPPTSQKYSCNSNNQCVPDSSGIYATSNCDGKCQAPPGTQKYSCNQNNQCVPDTSGQYTTSNCDQKCQPISLCQDPEKLAASNNVPYPRQNAPELNSLIACIKVEFPRDSLGSEFTFDNSYELCNYTRGQRTCTSTCSHAVYSCHYGGHAGSQGALAVDFGNQAVGDRIIAAARKCGAKSARCESASGLIVGCGDPRANHVHVNSASCDAN